MTEATELSPLEQHWCKPTICDEFKSAGERAFAEFQAEGGTYSQWRALPTRDRHNRIRGQLPNFVSSCIPSM